MFTDNEFSLKLTVFEEATGYYSTLENLKEKKNFGSLGKLPLEISYTSPQQITPYSFYYGRLVRKTTTIKGFYVDIGEKKLAFLPQKEIRETIIPHLNEGEYIVVQVKRTNEGIEKPIKVSTYFSIPVPQGVFIQNKGLRGCILEKEENFKETFSELAQSFLKHILDSKPTKKKKPQLIFKWFPFYTQILSNLDILHSIDTNSIKAINFLNILKNLISNGLEKKETIREILYEKLFILEKSFISLKRAISLAQWKLASQVLKMKKIPFGTEGGFFIIEELQTLTFIDINSGGKLKEEEVNFLALEYLAHLFRLRNLGGVIVIDFVRMDEEDIKPRRNFKKQILKEKFSEILKKYRLCGCKVYGFTKAGLFEVVCPKIY